ncbi:hypothetical protein GGD46_004087 [Rhizobium lusitanum]|uniref:Uncharacterized protein n=1 Tax=Rhizobium lusitanum TaxID=293958 RepID=A0A7X0MF91_9HYPH|nr:hypothetical protein [Rhizobium lusitanum]
MQAFWGRPAEIETISTIREAYLAPSPGKVHDG